MIRFDHLRVPVTDLARSRRWYVETLGLTVEFEVPDRQTVALQDSSVGLPSTLVTNLPRWNQCFSGTSPLAMAMKLASRDSEARRS